MGDTGARDASATALRLLTRDGPSDALVTALEEQAMSCVIAFRSGEAIAAADAALRTAASLGAATPARALLWRGAARCDQGDAGGLEDFEAALHDIVRQGRSRDLSSLYYNYAEALLIYEGTTRSIEVCQAGVEDMHRRGDVNGANALRGGMCYDLMWAGRWDEVLADGPALERRLEAAGDLQMVAEMRTLLALLALLQGDHEHGARQGARGRGGDRRLVRVRQPRLVVRVVPLRRPSRHRRRRAGAGRAGPAGGGDEGQTRRHRERLALRPAHARRARRCRTWPSGSSTACPCGPSSWRCAGCGRPSRRSSAGRWEEAAAAYGDAAARWRALSFVVEDALAQLGEGRCLVHASQRRDAVGALSTAHATFVRLRMPTAEQEAAGLLSQATSRLA